MMVAFRWQRHDWQLAVTDRCRLCVIRPKTACTVVVPRETDEISRKALKGFGVPTGYELEPGACVAIC